MVAERTRHYTLAKELKGLARNHQPSPPNEGIANGQIKNNWSMPKNKRSIQSKHHRYLGLWCCEKPPKNKDMDNILYHYCRVTKKNIIRKLCQNSSKLTLFRSFDDKAHVVPSTSTGMMNCRNQKVIQTTDARTAPKFYKYDFPKSMVNITPGTMLYMKKRKLMTLVLIQRKSKRWNRMWWC